MYHYNFFFSFRCANESKKVFEKKNFNLLFSVSGPLLLLFFGLAVCLRHTRRTLTFMNILQDFYYCCHCCHCQNCCSCCLWWRCFRWWHCWRWWHCCHCCRYYFSIFQKTWLCRRFFSNFLLINFLKRCFVRSFHVEIGYKVALNINPPLLLKS